MVSRKWCRVLLPPAVLPVPTTNVEHSCGLPRTGGDTLATPFPRNEPEGKNISISGGPSDPACSALAVDKELLTFVWSGLTDFVDNGTLSLTAEVLVSL